MIRLRVSLFCSIALLFLLGCGRREVIQEEAVRPRVEQSVPAAREVSILPPASTKSPEELRHEKKYGPVSPPPTPAPLEVYSYSTDPPVLTAGQDSPPGQLIVFLSSIVYEQVSPDTVSLELDGKPAEGIVIRGVELFEAQDLLVNFTLTPKVSPGRYDARVRIGEKEFFLPDAFEVRRSP